jgi:hypothetical protein
VHMLVFYPLLRYIILSVVLYGCGSWSLTLREECRLRVSGNRVLRRIFGSKRENILPHSSWRELTCYFHLVVQTSCDRFRKVQIIHKPFTYFFQ